MITWATFPFVRLTPALILGIVAYLYLGASWPELWPVAASLAVASGGLILWATRQRHPAATDAAGLLALFTVALLGATLTQRSVESRRHDHLARFGERVECYRAVVDDYTVARPKTFATTLKVEAIRIAGRWQAATGGIRISLPRVAGIAAPEYGQVWLVRGHPDWSKPPLNPGEFDYRQYLDYRQVYHQQYIHPDQYRITGLASANVLIALSMRAAKVLDGVFRHYIKAKREYAIASALVLGIKDDVDPETKQAYTATGTTHIMAVSGLQVGLLFAAMSWVLRRLFGRVRGFLLWSSLVGLAVIWSYAFLTGLSASVLRATVMFTFVIIGRALGRQDTIFNTLAVAAFFLLVWNPFLVADVGFQLSFLAVLSIVYLQPKIAKWVDLSYYFNQRRRPWQSKPVQWGWRSLGFISENVWQATALSIAAQVATFPLTLFYFHQFPLNFLFSNLVAVPISSYSVYVGLILLLIKGALTLLGLLLPDSVNDLLDYLPKFIAWVFEKMVLAFNEYIFWIAHIAPGAVIREIHLSALQALIIFGMLGAVLAWISTRRLAWLRWTAVLALAFTGSRVAEARAIAPDNEFIVYSIPRRSAIGFWQGASATFVTPDSIPLNETERTYRLLPGIIQRAARRTTYHAGWENCPIPVQRLADADSANENLWSKPGPILIATWHGLKVGFISNRISSATVPTPLDILVLRRNARVKPETLAAVFGTKTQVVFDSSCKIWYVARQDSALRANGFRTWDVTAQGCYRQHPPQ